MTEPASDNAHIRHLRKVIDRLCDLIDETVSRFGPAMGQGFRDKVRTEIAAAKAGKFTNNPMGAPKKITADPVLAALAQGKSKRQIARDLNVSLRTVYNRIYELQDAGKLP